MLNKKEIEISEKAKENIKILAKRANMSSVDLNNLMTAIIHEQTELGVPEDQLPDRVGRRMQANIKKQLKTTKRSKAEIKKYNEILPRIEKEHYKKDSKLKKSTTEIIEYNEKQKPDYFKQDLFEWKKMVYFKINYRPTKFFVIDYAHNKSFETTISRSKDKNTGKSIYIESRQELYGNISFEKVTEYEPIFEGIPRQYRFDCIDAYNKKLSYTGTFNDITTKIDEDGYLYNERKTKEILKKAKDLLHKKGNYLTSKLPPYPGFFWIDGKLQSNRAEISVDKELLKKALELLDVLIGFYNENKYKVGYILSWMLMAPFNFAMKQASNGDLLGATYLVGKANSGKTTIASLMMYIWNTTHTQTIFTAGSVDTVARFGGAISNTTYPVMFDEGSIIFNGNNNDIFDLFKSSIYDLKARTVMDTNRKSITIPSLSSIIFTSNLSAPKVASLGRRMHTFEFSVDHPRTPEEIEKFNATFDPHNKSGPMKVLGSIGDFVAISMLENPSYIKKNWLEIAMSIWKNMYNCVDMDVPDWITNYEMPAGLEEAWNDEEDRLFTVFKELLIRNADTRGDIHDRESDTHRPRTTRDKVEQVLKSSRESWAQLHTPKKGKNKDKILVVIDAGITEDMNKEYHLPYDLKRIAESLDGKYNGIHINGKTRKVAYWELDKFLNIFGQM